MMYVIRYVCVMYVIVYALFCNTGKACWRMLSIDERILLNQTVLIQQVNLPSVFFSFPVFLTA